MVYVLQRGAGSRQNWFGSAAAEPNQYDIQYTIVVFTMKNS